MIAARSAKQQTGFIKSAERVFAESAKLNVLSQRFDIFLSHTFSDKDTVLGVYTILKNMGYSVYVDWIYDPNLDRNSISENTASVLRKRMLQSKALFYITTTNHSSSKWMPWECGFYDGHNGHVAILPVVENRNSIFLGQDYLGLYPTAEKLQYGSSIDKLYIKNKTNSELFDRWVSRKVK